MASASTPNDQWAVISFPGPVFGTRAATASQASDSSQFFSEFSTGLSVALLAMISGGTTFFIQNVIGNKYATTDCDRQDEWNGCDPKRKTSYREVLYSGCRSPTEGTDKSDSYFLATSALTMADPSYKSSADLEPNGKEASVITERTRAYEVR
jgi:hypothetical protein